MSSVALWPLGAGQEVAVWPPGPPTAGLLPTEPPGSPQPPRLMQITAASRNAFLYLISWIFTLTK